MGGFKIDYDYKSAEYRPCLVNGENAFFHRWTEKDQVMFNFTDMCSKKHIDTVMKWYDELRVLPKDVRTKLIRVTVAIVEMEDGTIKEVDASSIKFLDSDRRFHENELYFHDPKELTNE